LTDPALISTVADLTAERDRDALEASLAGLLRVQVEARSATYHRLLGSDDGVRVWPVLRVTESGTTVLEDATDLRLLHRLEGARARCVEQRAVLRLASPGADRCTWLLPVFAEREAVGLVELEDVPAGGSPAREAAVASLLRIFRNHLALLDYGEHDTLTALRNRRTFDADFERMRRGGAGGEGPPQARLDARRVVPGDVPHWLGVVDVDRFKRVNDEFGHLYGDEVLLILAQTMRAQFRPVDRLYRFGGEEFVVVLARTAPQVALLPFERLRATVAARTFSRVGRVTVSIGVTRIGSLDDAAGAFGRADAALYHAKQNGRDQVHAWEDLVAAGLLAPARAGTELELF